MRPVVRTERSNLVRHRFDFESLLVQYPIDIVRNGTGTRKLLLIYKLLSQQRKTAVLYFTYVLSSLCPLEHQTQSKFIIGIFTFELDIVLFHDVFKLILLFLQ